MRRIYLFSSQKRNTGNAPLAQGGALTYTMLRGMEAGRGMLCRVVLLAMILTCTLFSTRAGADTWDGTFYPATTNDAFLTGAGIIGTGTKDDPYIIDSAYKFASLVARAAKGNYGHNVTNATKAMKYFRLECDIDLNGSNYDWTRVLSYGNANFTGIFDGNGHTISNMQITTNADMDNQSWFSHYGLFPAIGEGVDDGWRADALTDPSLRTTVKNLILRDPKVVINSDGRNTSCPHVIGMIAGDVGRYSTVQDCKIINPTVEIKKLYNVDNNNWNDGTLLGSAIGRVKNAKSVIVKNIYVENLNVSSAAIELNHRIPLIVGGVIGYVDYNGNQSAEQNPYNVKVSNLVSKGADIDLDNITFVDNDLYNVRFAIGGVIGWHSRPMRFPDNLLFQNGKIRARSAYIAPCVGMVSTGDGNSGYIPENYNYRTPGASSWAADQKESSKSATWYYNNYKIGIDTKVMEAATTDGKSKNYDADLEDVVDNKGYLTIGENTLKRINRYENVPVHSSTLLWWTRMNDKANSATELPTKQNGDNLDNVNKFDFSDWTKGDQTVYPQIGNTGKVFPKYYMYYAQGVNMDTQFLDNDEATAFSNGIQKNIEVAMGKAAKKVTLTLDDVDAEQRGYDDHSFTAKADGVNSGDVSSYEWYVEGVSKGTSSTLEAPLSFSYDRGWQKGTGVFVVAKDKDNNILASATGYIPTARLATQETDPNKITQAYGDFVHSKNVGTKSNPFVIKNEKELRLLSDITHASNGEATEWTFIDGLNGGSRMLMRSVNSGDNTTSPSFVKAYYELGADIALNTEKEFMPIGTQGASFYTTNGGEECGSWNNHRGFTGSFNGKGFTISGLRQTWYSGVANSNNVAIAWGLFGYIGGDNKTYYKVGDTEKTNAAVRNLILDNFQLTHKTDNVSFFHSGNVDVENGNSAACYIGTLAGIAGNYATIENISVLNSKITDDGSSTYNKGWNYWLSAGGVIGAARGKMNGDADLSNLVMRNLSANTDIDISKARYRIYKSNGNAGDQSMFAVGGIIGNIYTNADHATSSYPSPAFYSGKIKAKNAFVGPIFAQSTYKGNTGQGFSDFPKRFMGKTSATAVFDFADAAEKMYYNGFKVYGISQNYDGYPTKTHDEYYEFNESSLTITTAWGDRNLAQVEVHPTTNNANNDNHWFKSGGDEAGRTQYAYQGVNYGTYTFSGDAASLNAFNDYSSLSEDEQELLKDYTWSWSTNNDVDKAPVLTIGAASGLSVSIRDTYNGKTVFDHVLEASVTTASSDPIYYQWFKKVKVNGVDKEVAIDGATEQTYTCPVDSLHNQYVFVKAKVGGSADGWNLGDDENWEPTTELLVPKDHDLTASISKSGTDSNWTLTADITSDPDDITPKTSIANLTGYTITYQWKRIERGVTGSTTATDVDADGFPKYYYKEGEAKAESDPLLTYTIDYTYTATFSKAEAKDILNKDIQGNDTTATVEVKDGIVKYYKGETLVSKEPTTAELKAGTTTNWTTIADAIGGTVKWNDSARIYTKEVSVATYGETENEIAGATSSSYSNSSGSAATDAAYMHYCEITAIDNTIPEPYYEKQNNKYTFTLSILPANVKVVYLDPSNSSKNASDENLGVEPTAPVLSWHKAYSLLNPNGSWDDNYIVLMSPSDRARTSEGFYSNNYTAAQTWDSFVKNYYSGQSLRGNFTYSGSGTNMRKPEQNGVTTMEQTEQYVMSQYRPGYDRFKDTGEEEKKKTSYYSTWTNGDMWKNVTITGRYGEHDYTNKNNKRLDTGAIIYTPGGPDDNMMILGDTRFKNLMFYGGSGNGGHNYDILYCYYNNLEMGDSLVFVNQAYANRGGGAHLGLVNGAWGGDFHIFGGPVNDGRFKDTSKNGFDNELWEAHVPHKDGFSITIKSGFFSNVCSSYRQNSTGGAGIAGSPDVPVKCTINIDIDTEWNTTHDQIFSIDGAGTASTYTGGSGGASYPSQHMTYDVGCVLAGNHEGSMYGDVKINLYSGRVSRVANGNLGAVRDFQNKTQRYYIPMNAYMGRADVLIDPSKSRLVGTDGKTDNERLILTEIYGGSLGRSHEGNSMINVPFYGHSSITMNGGTITQLSNSATLSKDVLPGIYATGAGGVNGMYHVAENPVDSTAQRLPYWASSAHKVVEYGDWNVYNDNRGDKVYVKCYNTDTNDTTKIDLEDTQTTVVINGGVFGTEDVPLDGIYAGGSGYTSTAVLVNGTSYPNYRAGNVYAKDDATHPVASLTINGGEFHCPIYGGGRGTDFYYMTPRGGNANSNDGKKGSYVNYTQLGQIHGDVELNITGGTFHNNVYGGGMGFANVQHYDGNNYDFANFSPKNNVAPVAESDSILYEMARIYGAVKVNITGGTFDGNIYGGGAIANVGAGWSSRESRWYSIGNKNAITMNISGATIKGGVFGAAQGQSTDDLISIKKYYTDPRYTTTFNTRDDLALTDSVGRAMGNVELTITDSSVGGDIYGGAEKGDTYGDAKTTITSTEIGGYVYTDESNRIGGNIYGGGKGVKTGDVLKASADVKGSTSVTLNSGTKYVKLNDDENSEDEYKVDYDTPHYIYGGGNIASVIGTYNNADPEAATEVISGGNTTVNINVGMGEDQATVYGAGYGPDTYCNITNINITNFATETGTGADKKYLGLHEVYGGGNQGSVYDNTNVNMRGGVVFGNVFGGGNEAIVGKFESSNANLPFTDNTKESRVSAGTNVTLANSNATVYGDIFGGGNKANVYGTSSVSLSQGHFAGEVFGGGNGLLAGNGKSVTNSADVMGQTNVYVNGALVVYDERWNSSQKKFVYWAGDTSDSNFISTTSDDTPVFDFPHNIFGGGKFASVVSDTAYVEVTTGAVPSSLIKTDAWKLSFNDDTNPHFYVFGGGYGAFTRVKDTDVQVGVEGYYSADLDESTSEQWSLDIPFEGENKTTSAGDSGLPIFGNNYGIGGYTVLGVIGGGYAGFVDEDTNVRLGGTTFVHRVYGGGYGQLQAWKDLDPSGGSEITLHTINELDKTRDNLGEVGRNTRVLVSLSEPDESGRTSGVYGDVFGGGAGVPSAQLAGVAGYTDFPDMGKVRGITRVDVVQNARVYGNVYGGGDVGTIDNVNALDSTTVVKVRGGDVFGDVFGGGKGRLSNVAKDYTLLGNITGNSYVVINDSIATETFSVSETNDEGGETTSETTQTNEIIPNIWGNVYGGGEVGDVKAGGGKEGRATVNVNGGNIGGDIFGGGYGDEKTSSSADIAGSTYININGGSFLWQRIAETDEDGNLKNGNIKSFVEARIDGNEARDMFTRRRAGEEVAGLTALNGNFASVFDLENNLFVKDHNIYGGGNAVCTVGGDANVTVNHGMLNDDIAYYDDNTWRLSSLLIQLVTGNNYHPQFSVLGGGYGRLTTITGNTNVNVQVGNTTDDNYPEALRKTDRATWTALGTQYNTEFGALDSNIKEMYYGGSEQTVADGVKRRYITARMANIFSVPNHTFMNIVGGGMAGLVGGNAVVNINNQSMCQNVFGGGIGQTPASPEGDETYGQVAGSATVTIGGAIVKGNVYGGGAGIESVSTKEGMIDFPLIGQVGKNTKVTIGGAGVITEEGGTVIYGKVFGGGDIANVNNAEAAIYGSEVLVDGGCIFQQIFAGGSGRLASQCKDYRTLGKVNGNTHVQINDGTDDTDRPWLWNRIYGGGSYGSVTGNTLVDIKGGYIGYNIFGGGFGDVTTLEDGTSQITSSNVGDPDVENDNHTTTVNIDGGEAIISQMWDIDNKHWVRPGVGLSAQYDRETTKFRINHNIYGGGNAACKVTGMSQVNINHGMLKDNSSLGHAYNNGGTLFDEEEWKQIYNKVGSFHFCVIGGGYGSETVVDSTRVIINLTGAATLQASDCEESAGVVKSELHNVFKSAQSYMDIIGGAYNGVVNKGTYVEVNGNPYLRRIFGGSFYNKVDNTRVQINSVNVDDIFAGGMMGDVKHRAILNVGKPANDNNYRIFVNHDIYGGNDVSGQIEGLISVNIHGGKIYNNVYGAGNGNYLYVLNEDRQKVTAVENYEADGMTYDLVYEVPRRNELMPAGASAASEAARLVNINSYRPQSQFISVNVTGSASTPVNVYGGIFGGGNTSTVSKVDGSTTPTDTLNIGSYVYAKQVFMGADGEAMFDETTTGFLNAFKTINDIELSHGINWVDDPSNKAIGEKYLALDVTERQKTYAQVIDLYFQPVEMPIQPVLQWAGIKAHPDNKATIDAALTNTTVGSFFCGGNRGNMDVRPDENGMVFDYYFPTGLRVTDKIVGGCNNANFTRLDLGVEHKGGYLLGERYSKKPMLNLTVYSDLTPRAADMVEGKYVGGNVFGGCYRTGTVNGDISVNVQSNILNGMDLAKLQETNKENDGAVVASVFGAGYGSDSYVYGDIYVTIGNNEVLNSQGITEDEPTSLDISFEGANQSVGNKATAATTVINDAGTSVNSVYGGGELGNVIGNTTVWIKNGHVLTDVCGGSYSGTLFGSTQVLVGYPKYYKAKKSGKFAVLRADTTAYSRAGFDANKDIKNFDGSKAIKDTINLIQGDIIAPVVYDGIEAWDALKETSQKANFEEVTPTPGANWDNISILIDQAVYGAGYALTSTFSTTSGAGSYTVRKYTPESNVNNTMDEDDIKDKDNSYGLYGESTVGYGGNTTVLVWDDTASDNITISSSSTDGGFYGGGHLSYAQGFRTGELKGYGYGKSTVSLGGDQGTVKEEQKYLDDDGNEQTRIVERDVNNAKVMNTIQRLDLMRLTDNCLILNGARDYNISEISTTPYSIARVGELQMVSSIKQDVALPRDSTTTAYRNYVGLNNNIHYVGAIKSNAKFSDKFHDARGKLEGDKTYQEKKLEYIKAWYGDGGETYPGNYSKEKVNGLVGDPSTEYQSAKNTFNRRNDATAVNMIGLSSGYALKIQNVHTTDANGAEDVFYGPIDGVIEVKLIKPTLDEGGGYVYADNLHETPNEFLETSGNFVFPAGLGSGQYVVDDCLLENFDDLKAGGKNADASEMHYWFLTGAHYFYNLHITGYTYDSADEELYFDADTSDGLTMLEGAKDDLILNKVYWYGHDDDDDYSCDIQKGDKAYTLRLSASNATDTNGDVITTYNETADKSMYIEIPRNTNFDNGTTKLSKSDDEKTISFNNPLLAIQLVDAVNNSADNDDVPKLTAKEYYDKHLSKSDTVTIELRSQPYTWKTYTITLVIDYVRGPSYDGHINVANCALPGEFIKLSRKDLTIDTDATFAQNGEYWRFGKRTYNEVTGKYTLTDEYPLIYDASDPNGTEEDSKTSPLFRKKVHRDEAGEYIMIPASYFMNGYGVQYVFTCNNMKNTDFKVDIQPADTLVVHNYHEMKPSSTYPTDLHLEEAVARANSEPSFAEPRIYLDGTDDILAFQQFIDTVGVATDAEGALTDKTVWVNGAEATVPTAGAKAQFFLQNNITLQQYSSSADKYYRTPANFAGTFHGDGYSILGISDEGANTGALFGTLTGKVHNLGMLTGKIANTVDGGAIANSFEYGVVKSHSISNGNLVYEIDPTNLKVYNINGTDSTYTVEDFADGRVAYNLNQYYLEARKKMLTDSVTTQTDLAEEDALHYVRDYYADGDYQYARKYVKGTAEEYLRTADKPNYAIDISSGFDAYVTAHNTLHTVDSTRAADLAVRTFTPLYNAKKVTASDVALATQEKNDYIFFGQLLQAEPEQYPASIASNVVANMTNRVWRASGFYQSKVDEGYHYNAHRVSELATYVHNTKTTAIDFSGKRDAENNQITSGLFDNTADSDTPQRVFYAPAQDIPSEMYEFIINDGVTRNLLVYTDNAEGETSVNGLVESTLKYDDEDDQENYIKGHHVTGTPATSYSATRLHLVDKQDFNAPIQFTADNAWYIRNPENETGYVREPGNSWEAISLPFTVKTAILSDGINRFKDAFENGKDEQPQTSITYFYGDDDNVVNNPDIINHEFWFRGYKAINTSGSPVKATFKRPTNPLANAEGFKAYTPYIVSFPGDPYYEFDMTGQTIKFGADNAVIAVTDDNVGTNAVTHDSYVYHGAYLNGGNLADDGKNKFSIELGGSGDAFVKGAAVYPFRAYFTNGTDEASQNSMDYIFISDDLNKLEDVLAEDDDMDPQQGVSQQGGLRIYAQGKRIIVISDYATTLPVYTISGGLVRVLDVRPGTATYSGFAQGIYVAGGKKLRVR